jgi:hypothetical protein
MNFDHLDEFDRKIAAQIGRAFPDWLEQATLETDEYGEQALVVSVPAPSKNAARPLRIDTFGAEVTVSFDCHHGHFPDFSGGSNGTACDLVREIISDEKVVVSFWRDNQACGAQLTSHDDIPATNDEFPYANHLCIRSWSGEFDNDIYCEPRD